MDKKVYVVDSGGYGELDCKWLFDRGFTESKSLYDSNISLAILTGGEDIHPEIYGEDVGNRTYFNKGRDDREMNEVYELLMRKIPILGICRGAQLITAFSGGKLIQHVNNHQGFHSMKTLDGLELKTNSIHHQMMFPYTLPVNRYKILAWSKNISDTYLNGNNEEIILPKDFVEPEIVFYREPVPMLAIQGHPEGYSMPGETNEYIKDLVEDLLIKKIDVDERFKSKVAEHR